jgi:hypothetical protein
MSETLGGTRSDSHAWSAHLICHLLAASISSICGILDLRSVIWKRVTIWPSSRTATGPVNLARISPKPLQRVPIGLLPGDHVRNRVTVGE